jgi:hypothetical protein
VIQCFKQDSASLTDLRFRNNQRRGYSEGSVIEQKPVNNQSFFYANPDNGLYGIEIAKFYGNQESGVSDGYNGRVL